MAALAIPDVLGGEVILGGEYKRNGELAELVRQGVPAKSLNLLALRLDLAQAEISEKIGIAPRTLSRRNAENSRLTPAESDRTVRLAQVFSNAVETLGSSEKAAAWLKTP
jgi:putative toxin-antitoxin system antitoxin component (TIGR02293 family)